MKLGLRGETLEYKKGLGQLEKGLRSISAMLNKNGSGTLYLGCDDNGKVIGLSVGKKTLSQIRDTAEELILPIPQIRSQILTEENGSCYIRITARGRELPYAFDGRYYLRNGANDEPAGGEQLLRLLLNANNDLLCRLSSENQNLTFNDLRAAIEAFHPETAFSALFTQERGMLCSDGRYSMTAFLLSDQNDRALRIDRYSNQEGKLPLESVTFSDQCLLSSIRSILEYFKKIKNNQGEPAFDMNALQEALLNACLHHAWWDTPLPILRLYEDRIEIISFGGLPAGISREACFRGKKKPQNRVLYEIAGIAGFCGHGGVPLILNSAGEDSISMDHAIVTVTLPAKGMTEALPDPTLTLTENQLKVYEYLTLNPSANLQETAEALNISLGGAKKISGRLQELHLLKRGGSKRDGIWITVQR